MSAQPARKDDWFEIDGARVHVFRVSRNPAKPWVDIDIIQPGVEPWPRKTKRMPFGIPASWARCERGAA